MKPEIRIIEPIEVFYVRKTGNYMKAAEEAWDELSDFIKKLKLEKKMRALGISHDDPRTTPEDQLRYDACMVIEENVEPEGNVEIQTIPGGAYAIFRYTGPYEGLQEIYNAIFQTWLPTSGKKLRKAPMFEDYVVCEHTEKDPQKWVTEIYVPIEKL